ncbi:hypothetical protein HPB47_012788 [Ixodes persulcatus]|uniref:Uncharacterized protein n=1 Tax=Ixodes persulcatus TaxID=34615 RepID=A0AC60NSK5_IXOPE|nr:hypothetical protein HPB47_012788 [Ixodes persulcatus]
MQRPFLSMADFRARFTEEFLPPDYEMRIRDELASRTQHPEESLVVYIRALQELYSRAEPTASGAEKRNLWSRVAPGQDESRELATTHVRQQYDESWTVIRRRQRVLDAARHPRLTPPPLLATSTTASSSTKSSTGLASARGRPRHRAPPAERLPEDRVKGVLRPRFGFNLSTVSPITLADCVTQAAQLTPDPRDQILVFTTANYLLVSTPEEERARKRCSANGILVKGKQYEFTAHVSAPANTAAGIIFNIPEKDS